MLTEFDVAGRYREIVRESKAVVLNTKIKQNNPQLPEIT